MFTSIQYLIIVVLIQYTLSLVTNKQDVENENIMIKVNIDAVDHNEVQKVKSEKSKTFDGKLFFEDIDRNNPNKSWSDKTAKRFKRMLLTRIKRKSNGARLSDSLDLKIADKVIATDYDAILAAKGHVIESATHVLSDVKNIWDTQAEAADNLNKNSPEDNTTFLNYYETGVSELETSVSEEVPVKDMRVRFPKNWFGKNVSLFDAMKILVNKSDSFHPRDFTDDDKNYGYDLVDENVTTWQSNRIASEKNTSSRFDLKESRSEETPKDKNDSVITENGFSSNDEPKNYSVISEDGLSSNDAPLESPITKFDGQLIIEEMIMDDAECAADEDIMMSMRRFQDMDTTDYEQKAKPGSEFKVSAKCEPIVTWIHPYVDYPPDVDAICLNMLLWLTLDPVK